MFIRWCAIIVVMSAVAYTTYGETMCDGESAAVVIDLATGMRVSAAVERIRYSPTWGEGSLMNATVVVAVDGQALHSGADSGFVDWEPPISGRTYTLTCRVMSDGVQIGEMLTAVFWAKGDALCDSESETTAIDLSAETRTAAKTERLRYSTEWVGDAPSGAESVIDVNGEQLNSAAGTGFVDWTPMSNGTYTLTHKVVLGETQYGEILTATFLVTELPDTYSETQTTEIPVPYVWLSQYDPDIANTYDSYEAAAMAVAANGLKVWECYLAGLDPTNATSTFTASIAISNGVPWVTWSPNLNTNGIVRNYTILGKTNLTDTADWAPTNSAHRFFKVKVELP